MITSVTLLACLYSVGKGQQPIPGGRWELREAVRIGAIDGPDALASVQSVTVGSNGLVYISEGIAQAVRIYDRNGRLKRTIGGVGSGPGEFRAVGLLSWIGDTLIVADPALQRYSRFDGNGEFIESFRASPPGTSLSVGILEDGTAVLRPTSHVYAQVPERRMPLLRGRYPTTEATDTIAWIRAFGGGACTGRRVIVCLGTDIGTADIVRTDSRGRYVILVSSLRAEEPHRRAFVVSKVGPAGDTLMRSNVWYTPIPVPKSYGDSLSGYWTKWLQDPPGGRPALTREEAAEVVRNGLQLPTYYPPVTDAVAARNGDLWLEVRLLNGGRGWIVLDGAGRRKAEVVSPVPNLTLHAIDTLAWGVVQDELNVPYVIGFEIRDR